MNRTPRCPIARSCGGCAWLDVPYAEQLARKTAEMRSLFSDVAPGTVEDIVGLERPVAYRHKAATPFAPGKGGRVLSGFYARGTHRIVACPACPIEAEGARDILNGVARIAQDLRISAYREDAGRGLLRHAIVRMGWRTNEAMLTLVANNDVLPREKELARAIHKLDRRIVATALNVNQRSTNAMLGRETRILAGRPRMTDKLLGCTFEISPTAFYQTNPEQTEVLYRLAIEGAALEGGDRVLDAYCGSGTIGLCAADEARTAGVDVEVVGVEKVAAAVTDAKRNARINKLERRARFVAADATTYMRDAAAAGERFDVVIMDPPRAGATERFLESAAALEPRRMVYVSCNPKTQERDLAFLGRFGYRAVRITPVDMFPHTPHTETVAVVERG